MKEFLKKYKSSIIKTIIVIAILVAIAVGVYFILRACGFTKAEDYIALKNKFGDSVVFWLIVGLLEIVQVIFVPLTNQIITVPVAMVFNDELWKVWLTAWISIWLATLILYWIGRVGGPKLLKWILNDKEQVEKCTNFLNRGWIFYPIGMILPLPDDVITTLAGTAKMNFFFVAICSFFTRALDTAFSVFLYGYAVKHPWLWIVIILGTIGLFVLTFFLWKHDQKKRKALEQKAE
jgi:uncharacterized membrane protein YdjX (TVP38/TMEM64 family)